MGLRSTVLFVGWPGARGGGVHAAARGAATARSLRLATLPLLLLLVGCGVKGPPRAPGAAEPPPALQTRNRNCVGCRVAEPEVPALEEAEHPGAGESAP